MIDTRISTVIDRIEYEVFPAVSGCNDLVNLKVLADLSQRLSIICLERIEDRRTELNHGRRSPVPSQAVPEPAQGNLVDIRAVAQMLGVSQDTVRRTRELYVIKLRGRRLYDPHEIQAFINHKKGA